jgi:hypothetical protein
MQRLMDRHGMRNMLTEIPRAGPSDKRKPGTWERLIAHTPEPEYLSYWTAIVWCPDCGRGLLASLHTIANDGRVTPSLGHPASYPPCGWHTHPRLLGWEPSNWRLPPSPELTTCARCPRQSRSLGGWGLGWGYSSPICDKCIPEVVAAIDAARSAQKKE